MPTWLPLRHLATFTFSHNENHLLPNLTFGSLWSDPISTINIHSPSHHLITPHLNFRGYLLNQGHATEIFFKLAFPIPNFLTSYNAKSTILSFWNHHTNSTYFLMVFLPPILHQNPLILVMKIQLNSSNILEFLQKFKSPKGLKSDKKIISKNLGSPLTVTNFTDIQLLLISSFLDPNIFCSLHCFLSNLAFRIWW